MIHDPTPRVLTDADHWMAAERNRHLALILRAKLLHLEAARLSERARWQARRSRRIVLALIRVRSGILRSSRRPRRPRRTRQAWVQPAPSPGRHRGAARSGDARP